MPNQSRDPNPRASTPLSLSANLPEYEKIMPENYLIAPKDRVSSWASFVRRIGMFRRSVDRQY